MIGRAVVRAWVLLALALGGAGAARAQNFNFSYMISGTNVMGTFVTTSNNNGTYTITSILNGTRNGSVIGLLTPGSFSNVTGSGSNDNILTFPANPSYVDSRGFAYTAGGSNYDVFYSSSAHIYYEQSSNFPGNAFAVSNFTVTESVPASLPGGGLLSFLALGLAGLIHRRREIVGRVRDALARLRAASVPRPA